MAVRKLVVLMIVLGFLTGCTGSHLKIKDNDRLSLSGCLPLPNCVSSDSFMFYNNVAPFVLAVPAENAWQTVTETVRSIPRTEIVEERPGYIHAKCRSRVFRFVDNLELLLEPEKGIISVRSSSAFGLFDFGVNYFRVEDLRKSLLHKGIIK